MGGDSSGQCFHEEGKPGLGTVNPVGRGTWRNKEAWVCPGERKQVREGKSVPTTLYLSALPTLAVPSTTKTLVNFQASESSERKFYMLVIPHLSQVPGRERCPFLKEVPTGYQQQSPPCIQSMWAAGTASGIQQAWGFPDPREL